MDYRENRMKDDWTPSPFFIDIPPFLRACNTSTIKNYDTTHAYLGDLKRLRNEYMTVMDNPRIPDKIRKQALTLAAHSYLLIKEFIDNEH